jgi:hypothetical protein
VNIWLQEFIPFFRHTPWFLDRLLDGRRLLTWLSGRTAQTKPEDLGAITVSALEGEAGHQRKEVEKLACLLRDEFEPDVVHLSNILLLGLARPIRAATGARIVCSLSGEDIFIGQLPPAHRDRALALIRERLNRVRSPFRTAEHYGVEDIIDPRDTRPLLCEFAELAWAKLGAG